VESDEFGKLFPGTGAGGGDTERPWASIIHWVRKPDWSIVVGDLRLLC
jgi:hypothetical protein